ncbi:phosphate acyltransferase PlsX [Opitutales bacterium ASA1]|uniref:phosphate acyltransferase PlsX n=1 Tax=Congregicoccus parvus TaxID=3081749 RepID=UPI002B2DD905|nr:phosphate acyltransferase PlsX [Opitutales bacterium ASA1]
MTTATVGNRIAVDAMGSDLGPAEMVAAVAMALRSLPGLEPITLVGREDELRPLLASNQLAEDSRVTIVHASEVIEMTDKPLQALKRKKDASMLRAIDLVKAGEARAVVSCGNTGALMAAGTLRLRMLDGLERPALAGIIPRRNGHFVLIDAGANPEARPEHLVHNAILGSHYCRIVLEQKNPRVGLLTIGTEEGKGNELITASHDLLKRLGSLIRYSGPIEGFQVFEDTVDVVVCDGFVGNICLKTWESLAKFVSGTLKDELRANPLRMAGAALASGAFTALKHRIRPERYGGAPLLGVRGNILKAHGSSNREAVMNAIRVAHEIVARDLNERIVYDVAQANELIAQSV